MKIYSKVNEDLSCGGNYYFKDIKEGWTVTEVVYEGGLIKEYFNGSKWIENATEEEIKEFKKSLVPLSISRMKFKMQIRRSTHYTYEIIIAYIQNIPVSETFTEEMKADILDRLEDCVIFERYSPDFIMLSNMMGVSDEKKDEIFIEGNKII